MFEGTKPVYLFAFDFVYITYMNKHSKIFIQLLTYVPVFPTINGRVFDGLITTHNLEATH